MDKQIWHNIIAGDRQAYAGLYTDYFKKFYNYGRKFTYDIDLIEDSIQEVFLHVWLKREKMTEVESANSYLFSSFRYTLFKKIRLAKRLVEDNDTEAEPEFSIDHAIILKEAGQELEHKLQAALRTLTARQREAIFLRFYEGLSYEEVAAVLNISVKATYKIMARSLACLKDSLSISLGLALLLLRAISAKDFSSFTQ